VARYSIPKISSIGGTKWRLLAREPPLTIAPTHADNGGDANTAGPVIP
jgi:hypothetical protein